MKKIICILLAVMLLCGCAPDPSAPEDVIDTEYFTLTLPEDWIGTTTYEILPDGECYSIDFYERQDYETSGTGKLCTLKLFKEGEDFTVPGHMTYGTLVAKITNFEVVVLYPTDITCTPANAAQHEKLLNRVSDLVYSLEPKDDCKWLVPQWDIPNPQNIRKDVIELLYYTITVPQAWEGKYVDFIEEFEDGTSIVSFYEKECYEDFGGGKICSIQLLPEEMDWSSVEDASLFGGLKTPDGFFIIVGIFPEEKQYSKETKETYDALRALTPDLFGTITAKEGCEVIRAGFSTDLPADSFQS